LTSDKGALLSFLDQIHIDMTGVDGTAMGMALATAADRLRESKAASKVILLLTDGRNNRGEIDPLTAAKAAAALEIKIYAVGAGSPEGGLIPLQDPLFGTRYVRNPDDLDEQTLTGIASATEGTYFRAKDVRGLQAIFDRINRLEKSEYKIMQFTNYEDHYFGWLETALGLLLLTAALQQTVFRRIP
jgi:Ca-activated chloride channel family protein